MNKTKLHVVGFWCDTRQVSARIKESRERALSVLKAKNPELFARSRPVRYPHPKYFVSEQPIPDARRVCEYLRGGHRIREQMGYAYCRLAGDTPDEEMGTADMTDGTWVWPEGLPIYVERYNVRLPDEFVEHMRRGDFKSPPCALNYENVQYHLEKWTEWSERCGAFDQDDQSSGPNLSGE